MAVTQNTYTGNGSTTNYSLTFQYLEEDEIKVSLNGTLTTAYTLANATTISFTTAPANGVAIRIYRDTNVDSLQSTFFAGSAIRAQDLNDNFNQVLYSTQETVARRVDSTGGSMTGNLEFSAGKGIVFEGATDDAHETTLLGGDPTADRTLNLPNVSGTLVSTGDTGTVTSTMLADNTIVNADINSAAAIDKTKISGTAITAADTGTVTSAMIADGAIVNADINASAAIAHSKLASVAAGSVLMGNATGVPTATAFTGDVTISSAGVTAISAGAVVTADLADQSVTSAKIADGVIDSTKLTGATVVTNAEHTGSTPNDTSFFTTSASDSRYFRQDSSETITSGNPWSSSDTYVATTAAIDARVIDLVDDVGGFVPITNETSFPLTNPDINNPDGSGTIISIKEIVTTRTPASGTVTIANGAGSNTVTINGCGSTVLASGFGVLVETTSTLHTYNFHRLVPKATEVTTVAGISGDITTVATNNANVTAVAGNAANINTVAGNNANVTAVATNSTNINAVAGNATNINAVAGNAANINTVSTNIANVNNVGGSIANVNSVASNLGTVNDFAARYRVASSDPVTSLDTGDLVFNTTNNELRVYNGTAWQGGVTATGNLVSKSGDTMTGPLGVTAGTAALPSLFISGDPNTGIYSPGADQVAISTGGSGRLFVDSSGRVGVGTASPAAAIDAVAESTNGFGVRIRGRASDGFGGLQFTSNDGSSQTASLGVASSNTIVISTGASERLRITSAGLVGIGTSSPATSLEVRKTSSGDIFQLSTADDSGQAIKLGIDTTNKLCYFRNNTSSTYKYAFQNTAGTNVLVIDNSGNVGIGTTSPSSLLHVTGGSGQLVEFGTGNSLRIGGFGTGNCYVKGNETTVSFGNVNAGNTVFLTGDTERARIDSSGRLGIGTSTPASILELKAATPVLTINGTAQSSPVGMALAYNGTNYSYVDWQGSTGELRIASGEGGSGNYIRFRTNGTNAMTIDSSQRVGIGTSSPAEKLHIADDTGRLRFTNAGGTGTAGVDYYANTTERGYTRMDFSTGALAIGTVPAWPITFTTNNTERVRITSTGNVGIGTASPASALEVAGTASEIARFRGNGASGSYVTWNSGGTNYGYIGPAVQLVSGTSTQFAIRSESELIFASYGGNERARIDTSGRLLVGTSTAYGSDDTFVVQKTNGGARIGLQRSATGEVLADQELGAITFYSNDGDLNPSARIQALADLDHGVGDKPGRLSFSVTADGASSPTERMRIANNGAISTVVPGGSTLYPAYDCRAWVNFNGTSTVSIRGNGNVSSITDNGTGDYTVNFTTAMADGNYGVSFGGGKQIDDTGTNGNTCVPYPITRNTGSVRLINMSPSAGATQDSPFVSISVFR